MSSVKLWENNLTLIFKNNDERLWSFLNLLVLMEIVTDTLGREPSKVELCQLFSVSSG